MTPSSIGFGRCALILVLLGTGLNVLLSAGAQSTAPYNQKAEIAKIDSLAIADSLFDARRLGEFEALTRRMIPRVAARYDSSSKEMALVLDRLVLALWMSGRSQSAETIRLAERARDLKLQFFGADHPELAESLFSLGVIRTLGGDFAAADSIFRLTLEIRERHLPRLHPDVISTVSALANVRHSAADYAGAMPYARRALALAEELGGPTYAQALTLRGNVGNLLTELGEYNEARTLMERQIELLEETGHEDENLAFAYSILARVHFLVGDHAAAIPLRERCLHLREKLYQGDHPRLAEALLNLGTELWKVGELAEGREYIQRARDMWEALYGPGHIHMAGFDEVLGRIAHEQGDLTEARRYHERVLEMREAGFGPESPKVAEVLASLGSLSLEEGDLDTARRDYERAITIIEEQLGHQHPLIAEYADQLALTEFLSGDFAAAIPRAVESEMIWRQNVRLTLCGLPERQALRYARRRPIGLDVLLSLGDRQMDPMLDEQIWDLLIRSRALVLDEMATRNRLQLSGGGPDSLWEAYRGASHRLANLYIAGPEDGRVDTYTAALAEARRTLERTERALSVDRGRDLTSRAKAADIGFEDVRAALPPDGALIAYVQYRHYDASSRPAHTGYRAVLLSAAQEHPTWFDLGDAAQLHACIAAWKQEVSLGALRSDRSRAESMAAYRSTGEALRAALWDPIAARLGPVRRVFIVPDGEIHLVTFAALPGADDRFLIEGGYSFHYLSTERELAAPSSPLLAEGGALILGAPDFEDVQPGVAGVFRGPRADRLGLRSITFAPLPGSLEEAREVANAWGAHLSKEGPTRGLITLLTGQEASEGALKRLAPGNQVLHIATHGFFLGDTDLTTPGNTRGIGLLVEEDASPERVNEALENPLLLSGLALAGANRRNEAREDEEDGILTAQEIATLDLSTVRWAVLSACETGTGRRQVGEGVLGLRRAFRVAGAHSLITSLWSVKDDATREWMQAFYAAAMQDPLDTMTATNRACMQVLTDRRARRTDPHPFYWAAFIASGDWR